MATETEKSTREQVEELFDAGTTTADEIAEKLGKSKGTVYVHLRNIQKDRGIKPRGRGRPPANQDGKTTQAQTKPRPAPRKAPQAANKTGETNSTSKTGNGHVTGSERFPLVAEAVQRQISEKQREIEVLQNILDRLTK